MTTSKNKRDKRIIRMRIGAKTKEKVRPKILVREDDKLYEKGKER